MVTREVQWRISFIAMKTVYIYLVNEIGGIKRTRIPAPESSSAFMQLVSPL